MRKFKFIVFFLSVSLSTVFAQQTSFPSELGIGQTWNRSLTKRIGQVIALEARHQGVAELPLPPLKYGDSPYLVAELGIEMSKGLYTYSPVTGMDRTVEGDAEARAAFERITHESGILTPKTFEPLPTLTSDELANEKKEYAVVALQALRESIVLLKNENNVLPIARSKRISVSSPYYNKKERGKALAEARGYDVLTVIWDAEAAEHVEARIWLKTLCALGKPVILVLSGNEPFAVDAMIAESVSAVIAAWFPKSTGGELIGDVIRGIYAPGSRLTAAIYDTQGNVLYPMGHGLSYTTISYSDLTLEPVDTDQGKNYIVRFNVTNTGKRTSDEVALLYLQKVSNSADAKSIRMEGFKRTNLKPGETKEIKFTIRPRNLEVVDQQMNRKIEPGEYKVTLSGQIPSKTFTVTP